MIFLYGEPVWAPIGIALAMAVAFAGVLGIGFFVVRRRPPVDLPEEAARPKRSGTSQAA